MLVVDDDDDDATVRELSLEHVPKTGSGNEETRAHTQAHVIVCVWYGNRGLL